VAAVPTGKPRKTATSPIRQQDYAEWYQQVVRAADLAESSRVSGSIVIKPWGTD
jgi:prolyl-tRNA synthetase